METKDALEKFGKFLVEKMRDRGIDFAEGLLSNRWKAPALQSMQLEFTRLTPSQKEVFKQAFIQTIDTTIHDFLFALQERADFENDIQILVDGKNVIELSDGLQGEPYSDKGWNAKYSKFKP